MNKYFKPNCESKIIGKKHLFYPIMFILSLISIIGVQTISAQCRFNQEYDKIVSGYHATIALSNNGNFVAWGENIANDGLAHQAPPKAIIPANYPVTGTVLFTTIGGKGNAFDNQFVALTTDGLFAWGKVGDASNYIGILSPDLKSTSSFGLINTPTGGDPSTKLPLGVSPSQVTMMFATTNTLAIVANGNVWVLSILQNANIYGDGSSSVTSTSPTTWHKVKKSDGTDLTNVTEIRGQVGTMSITSKNAMMALTSNGSVYTWGSTVYLGDNSNNTSKNSATLMTLPAEFTSVNIPKMIGVTGGSVVSSNTYYLLSNSGALYALGNNAAKQCGDFTNTERKSWVNVKSDATTNFTDVDFLSVQEHTNYAPAASLITKSGVLYTWGYNDGYMLGRPSSITNYDPGIPTGFTVGSDKARYAELGGHTLVYVKEGSDKFCYVGHRSNGSMGESTTSAGYITSFDCTNTPIIALCGATAPDPTQSGITSIPSTIVANGTSTSTITVQLKDAAGVNLTATGGDVAVTTTNGTLGTVTDNNNGTYTVILTSSNTITTTTLGFSLNGTNASGVGSTAAVIFSAPPPSPTMTTTGSLKTFTNCSGCTFTPQSFTVAGANLTSNVIVSAPTGFQVASTLTGTYTTSISLTPSAGTLSNTSVFVRLTNNATAAASGNLTITTTGVAAKTITLTTNTDNAINLDGTNDKITIADNNDLDLTNNYTIEAWIKPTAFKAFAGIISKYHSASSNGYNLKLTGVGNYSGISFDEMSTKYGVLSLNKWNHIAAVNNNGTRKVYINGIEQVLTGTPMTTAANTDPVIIGQDSSSSGSRFFKGSIDEVRIWNTARTASDITNNMNVSLTGNETGLVANYNFDQGIPNGTNTNTTIINDYTSNAFNGTVSGLTLTGNTSNFVDGFMPSITPVGNESEVLLGKTLLLTNSLTGGVWSSTNTNIATVNPTTGLVTGVATGTASITYSICGKTVAYNLNVTLITCSGTLSTFTGCFGSPSAAQSVVVNAVNLTSNLIANAPAGYEVATSAGGTYSTSISLTPISGNISNTSIFIRLSSKAFNGDHGNLILTSGNVAPKLFPIGLASVNLNVPAKVTISSNIAGNKICSGTSTNVIFTASVINGGLTPTFQWKLNGANVGTNSATYSNSSLTTNSDVSVTMISSLPGCVTGTPAASNSITIAVYSIPATPTAITGITTICAGSNAAYITNGSALASSYDWVVTGNMTQTASTSNALNTLAGNTAGGASIKVRAVNFCGASPYTNDHNITISNTPAPTANFTISNNEVCITASSINYTNTSLVNSTTNSPFTTYDWDFGDGSSATTENSNRIYTAPGKYNVILKIQSQDGCLSSITKPVNVSPLSVGGTPTVIDTAICEGTSTTINLNGYTGSIQWMSSPAGANTWTNLVGQNGSVLNTGNLTESTDYKAEVRSGVCTVATSATVSVTVKKPPVVTIFPPTGVKKSDTTFNLSYTVSAGNPNAYSVGVFGSNPMPNFTPNNHYALRSSPITIAIPPSGFGNYVFTFVPTELPYACYSNGGQPLTFTLGVGQGEETEGDTTISLSYNSPNVYNVGTAITALTPNVTGGTFSASAISPTLPAGLTFDQNTGIISGTPTAISSQTSYVVTGTISATTVSATVDITVNEALPGIKYTTPNIFTVGTAITALTPTSTAVVITSYAISPVLPAGLTINTLTGIISGTPSAIATRTSYVVTGTYNAGTVSTTVVITVNGLPPAPPTVINGRFIFGKPGLPTLMSAFVNPLPNGIVPVWCTLGTQNCSTTVPLTPTAIGKYIFQLRSYDTVSKLYSINSVNDTLIIAPAAPTAIDSTYVIGVATNPVNIGVQVTGLTGATINYFYLGVKQTGIPAIGNIVGTKKYSVIQTVNGIESDTSNFNVTILDPNSVIHLQKIVDSGAMQSNSTYNFQFKLVVTNLTNTPFNNVILIDNLQNSVPITSEYSVISNTATGGLKANSSFNGNNDINVTLATSTVAPLAKDTAKFVMNFVPKGYSGILTNVAYIKVNTRWGTINMQSSESSISNPTSKTPTKYQVRDLVLNIPEGFSPNNDGVHDYFVVIKPLNYSIDLEVFNRWGNVVFSSNNYNNDWDGKGNGNFAGQDLVDGGYYYSLRAVDDKGKIQVFKGFVIIQR